MSRLVDLNEVIRVAKNTFPEEDVRKIMWVLCYTPTAYDIEKVVDVVREDCYSMGFDESQTKIIIGDVRKGGVE